MPKTFTIADPATNEVIAPEGMNYLVPGQIIHIIFPAINNSWINIILPDSMELKADIPGFKLIKFYDNPDFTCTERVMNGVNQLTFNQPNEMPADDYELIEVDLEVLDMPGTGWITSNVIVKDLTKLADYDHKDNEARMQRTIVPISPVIN